MEYKVTVFERFFFFQAEDGIRDYKVTGVQTCALPILSIRSSIMAGALKVEIDHLAHDEAADQHPSRARHEHHAAHRMGPEKLDVARAGDIDEDHHRDRQGADDDGGSLGFHRHRLDLALHLLAVAQHARQVAERFRQVAARLLLNADDDAEETAFGE